MRIFRNPDEDKNVPIWINCETSQRKVDSSSVGVWMLEVWIFQQRLPTVKFVSGLCAGDWWSNLSVSQQIWVNGSVNLSLEYGRKTLPHNLLSTTTARQRAALEDGDQSNIFLLSIHCITTVIATVCNSYSKIVKLEIVFLYFIYSMLDVGLKQLKTMIGVGSSSSM